MTPTACFNRIRAFIASDELPAALDLLRKLLAHSPLLGTVSPVNANPFKK